MTQTDTKRLGRIYQLVNMMTNEKYIGSTFQPLHKRMNERRRTYRKWLKGSYPTDRKLFSNIDEYGWECFRMELLEEIEVKNKQELRKLEGDWIRKLDTFKNGLNGEIAGRTKEEYEQDEKEKLDKFRKLWRQNNKEKAKAIDAKNWKRNYKKYQKDIVRCECGISMMRRNFNRHLKTKTHKENLKLQKEIDDFCRDL